MPSQGILTNDIKVWLKIIYMTRKIYQIFNTPGGNLSLLPAGPQGHRAVIPPVRGLVKPRQSPGRKNQDTF
jgi:hypothetical protein